MKGTIAIISLTVLWINVCQSTARVPQSQSPRLVLEGIVEKIGSAPGIGSGDHAVYQFAKYRVTSVCEGEYDQQDIIVDHLILEGNELGSLHAGDKIGLVIKKSKTIFHRNDEDGFRDADDKVDVFYIGERPKVLAPNCAPCEPCQQP